MEFLKKEEEKEFRKQHSLETGYLEWWLVEILEKAPSRLKLEGRGFPGQSTLGKGIQWRSLYNCSTQKFKKTFKEAIRNSRKSDNNNPEELNMKPTKIRHNFDQLVKYF